MFIRFFLVVLSCVSVMAVIAQVGGWSPADPASPEVLQAANFAINTRFPNSHPSFKVIEARKQVILELYAIYFFVF